MLKNRLIPVLFLKHGWLVRSEGFAIHQNLGNPVAQVERYSAWDVDELIYIDITPDDSYDMRRDDLGGLGGENPQNIEEIISLVARKCFMPLTFGGKIRGLEDIRARLRLGADKVTINTQALTEPIFIAEAAREFGSQAIVVSIDAKRHDDGRLEVFSHLGRRATGRDPADWAREAEAHGAGEIFINSIDLDGKAGGYDLDLVGRVAAATTIPIIACGGVGDHGHFVEALTMAGASAVAAGNIFHFKEMSYPLAKRHLKGKGVNVR